MAHTDVIERLPSCRLSGGKPEMVDVRPNRREWPDAELRL